MEEPWAVLAGLKPVGVGKLDPYRVRSNVLKYLIGSLDLEMVALEIFYEVTLDL